MGYCRLKKFPQGFFVLRFQLQLLPQQCQPVGRRWIVQAGIPLGSGGHDQCFHIFRVDIGPVKAEGQFIFDAKGIC